MKYNQIAVIRNKFEVSYKDIAQYNNNHKSEIEQIDKIFNLKDTSDKEKTLALLYILSLGEDDAAISEYRRESGFARDEYNASDLLERYKDLLIASLIFNEGFYAMAENYRGIVGAGLGIGVINKESSYEIEIAEQEIQLTDGYEEEMPFHKNVPVKVKNFIDTSIKAVSETVNNVIENVKKVFDFSFIISAPAFGASADHKLKKFDSYHVDDIFGIYSGDFLFYGDYQDELLQVRFQFINKNTGETLDKAPCYFDIELISNADNTSCNLRLDQSIKGVPSVICSSEEYINYSKGIKVNVLIYKNL